jgi:hypothetical protein
LTSTVAARSRRAAAVISSSGSASVEEEALSDASGARRSWATAATRVFATRAISASTRVRSACSRSCARSTASAM